MMRMSFCFLPIDMPCALLPQIEMLDMNLASPSPIQIVRSNQGLSHPVGLDYYDNRIYYLDEDLHVSYWLLYGNSLAISLRAGDMR